MEWKNCERKMPGKVKPFQNLILFKILFLLVNALDDLPPQQDPGGLSKYPVSS